MTNTTPTPGLITRTAQFLSAVFSPLLMGTYGIALSMWLSYLCYSSIKAKLIVTAVTLLITCVIPAISIVGLYRAGVIKDPALNNKTDRTVPYIISALCYFATGIYYHYVSAPVWLSLFVFGGAAALTILISVNRKWKISGHATGTGGIVAMLFFIMCSGNSPHDMQWQFIIGVIIAGAVCSSRLILDRHTLMQVAAGFANGFACVFLPAWYLCGAQLPPIPSF